MRGRQTRKRRQMRIKRLVERRERLRYRWWETQTGANRNGAQNPAASVVNRTSLPSSSLFCFAMPIAMAVLAMRRMAAGMAE